MGDQDVDISIKKKKSLQKKPASSSSRRREKNGTSLSPKRKKSSSERRRRTTSGSSHDSSLLDEALNLNDSSRKISRPSSEKRERTKPKKSVSMKSSRSGSSRRERVVDRAISLTPTTSNGSLTPASRRGVSRSVSPLPRTMGSSSATRRKKSSGSDPSRRTLRSTKSADNLKRTMRLKSSSSENLKKPASMSAMKKPSSSKKPERERREKKQPMTIPPFTSFSFDPKSDNVSVITTPKALLALEKKSMMKKPSSGKKSMNPSKKNPNAPPPIMSLSFDDQSADGVSVITTPKALLHLVKNKQNTKGSKASSNAGGASRIVTSDPLAWQQETPEDDPDAGNDNNSACSAPNLADILKLNSKVKASSNNSNHVRTIPEEEGEEDDGKIPMLDTNGVLYVVDEDGEGRTGSTHDGSNSFKSDSKHRSRSRERSLSDDEEDFEDPSSYGQRDDRLYRKKSSDAAKKKTPNRKMRVLNATGVNPEHSNIVIKATS